MGIDFNELKKKAEGVVEQHGDKIEDGVEKAGEFAKNKFGHHDKIDQAVDKIQDMIPDKEPGDPQQPGTPQPGTPQPGTPQPVDPQQPETPQPGDPRPGDPRPTDPGRQA